MEQIWQIAYIFAALSIVGSIKWLSSPATARRGVMAGQIGMLFAVVGTLLRHEVVDYEWILISIFIGAAIGAPLAYLMPMTAVPQLTALSHAFGALAAALVGTAEYYKNVPTGFTMTALVIETVLGYLTFTASIMAFGKLQEIVPTRPITYKGQNFVNIALLIFAVSLGVWMIIEPTPSWVFPTFTGLSLLFGVLLIIPIGGGDMPTVIALLNSYAGAACAAMGFALSNRLLIIAGALNAASGFILSVIMCKAMNRSFLNVLFGAFGQVQEGASTADVDQAGSLGHCRRRGRHHERSPQDYRRSRLWNGRRPSAAQAPRTDRCSDQTRRRSSIRHSPCRRPHAGPHERAARRSRHSLRQNA